MSISKSASWGSRVACCCAWLVATMSLLTGCRNNTASQRQLGDLTQPSFRRLYDELKTLPKTPDNRQEQTARLTLAAEAMPLEAFLREVSNQAGVSIVAEERLDKLPVTLDVIDQQVSDVLGMVGRRMGVQVSRTGSLYFLGTLRPEDKGVLVRRVRRLSEKEINDAVQVLLSEFGRVRAYADGLVVVGDRVEVLQRVQELIDGIENAPAVSWVVQMHVVTITDSDLKELGLEVEPAAELAYTFSAASGGSVVGGVSDETAAKLKAGLSGVLKVAREKGRSNVLAEPVFVLLDGGQAKYSKGQRVPIPKRVVSDQGTITTAGYDEVQTGFEMSINLREISADDARVTVEVKQSDISGFVEQAPILAAENVNADLLMRAGGVYLVGSVSRKSDAKKTGLGWLLGGRREEKAEVLQVWARAYRIGGLAKEAGK